MRTNPLHSLALLFVTGATLLTATAGSVDRKQIAADAKWVLHLDAKAFRDSKVGAYFLKEILDPKSADGKAHLKSELDFDLDWQKIESATAYGGVFPRPGAGDPDGVLLVKTSLGVEAALERAIARQLPTANVRKIESGAAPVYALNDQVFVAFARDHVAVVGKNQSVVENGRAVLEGKAPSLATSNLLSGYPESTGSFFFLAVAEGFAKDAPLPENAAVLKSAQGARFTVGEHQDDIVINLALRTISSEVAQQMQQVAQGFVALVALQGNQNQDLQSLAKSLTVNAAGSMVSLSGKVPVPDVLKKLDAKK